MVSVNKTKKMGRPVSWPEPTTDISKRLQKILPKVGKLQLGDLFFDGMSERGVESILSGKSEPPPSSLITISKKCGRDLMWLLTGEKREDNKKSPPSSGGDEHSIQKLFSSLAEAHKALSILAESVVSGEVSVEDAENAVAEALKTVWQVHGKPAKADKRRHSKTDTRDTGTSA